MNHLGRTIISAVLSVLVLTFPAQAQYTVKFPPAQSKPPPPVKSPPRAQSSGEETILLDDTAPTMRKTQERKPPPPTTLTVMYKVQYGGQLRYVYPNGKEQIFDQWQSFKNDGYQLIKYTNERLADGNNYQYAVQPLSAPVFDPVDIPILYMTGDYAFEFRESEVQNLRKFILDGGTIIFNAARGREEFSLSVVRQMRRVLPGKTFMKMSPDHPVFNCRYRIKRVMTMISGVQSLQEPQVYSIDVGTRAAAILVPGGMGAAWAGRPYHPKGTHIVGESAVRLGVNLVAYVLASTEYGRFLAQEFPQYDQATRSGDVFRYAAAKYAGSWDVNPAVQNSLLRGLKDNTGIDVDYNPYVVELTDPQIGRYPLVFITGHYDFRFTDEELENVRRYLRKGGMLLSSSAAGLRPYDLAFRRQLKRLFPEHDLIRVPPTHPIFAAGWNPIGGVEYTPAALRDDPGLQYPRFYGLFVDDQLVVLHTPYDMLSAVNRESNAYAKGLTSDDAMRIAINIITYSLSH